MFHSFALDGLWLIVALAAAWFGGMFASTAITDWIKGVPTPLRAALSATEASALAELEAAKAQVVKDVAGLFAKAKAALAADLTPKATTTPPAAPAGSTGAAPAAPVVSTGAVGSTGSAAPAVGATGATGH
jgi:hypothetical protein